MPSPSVASIQEWLAATWPALTQGLGDASIRPLLAIGAGLLAVFLGALLLRRAKRALWAAAFSAALVAGWWWASRNDAWSQLLEFMR